MDDESAVLRASLNLQSIDFWEPVANAKTTTAHTEVSIAVSASSIACVLTSEEIKVLQYLKNAHPDLYERLCVLSQAQTPNAG